MDTTTDAPVLGKKGTFPATVAKVLDNYKLVINKGSEDGIRQGQRMLVYGISDEEIKDPRTGKSLGYLELVRGTGKIAYIEEKMSILESDKISESSISYEELKEISREILGKVRGMRSLIYQSMPESRKNLIWKN